MIKIRTIMIAFLAISVIVLMYLPVVADELDSIDAEADAESLVSEWGNDYEDVFYTDYSTSDVSEAVVEEDIEDYDFLPDSEQSIPLITEDQNALDSVSNDYYVWDNEDEGIVGALGYVPIDNDHFTDTFFRTYVKTFFDTDGDGWLSEDEQYAVTEIDVTNAGIKSLSGLSYFPNLKTLICSNNQIDQLNISKNTALVKLCCERNELLHLNISNNRNLEWLECHVNNLKNLDLAQNTALQYVSCGGNEIGQLDVSKDTELRELYCSSNKLGSLNLSNNKNLISLSCDHNQLNELNVSENTDLRILFCGSNLLTDLNVKNNPELVNLNCNSNKISNLELCNNPRLGSLSCQSNNIKELDIRNNTELYYLDCLGNKVNFLDISNCNCLLYAYYYGEKVVGSYFENYNCSHSVPGGMITYSLQFNSSTEIITNGVEPVEPTSTPSPTPKPTSTPSPTPKPTVTPSPTSTPEPTDTSVPVPIVSPTAFPTEKVTSTPSPSEEPIIETVPDKEHVIAPTVSPTTEEVSIEKAFVTGLYPQVFTGHEILPQPMVLVDSTLLALDKDYSLVYTNNTNAGIATIVIVGKGQYSGIRKETFIIQKAANGMSVTVNNPSVKASKTKKKSVGIAKNKIFNITNAQGKVTFKKKSGPKNLCISSSGKITIKKGTKKGTYKLKVSVNAAGNANYEAVTKMVTIRVKVR